MSAPFTTLAHTLRPMLAAYGMPLSLGHTHQLLAAACGYQSYAAWQKAKDEPDTFDPSMHWLVDRNQILSRAGTLALTFDVDQFIGALDMASRELRGATVHASAVTLHEQFVVEAQQAAEEDDAVGNQMADTNCYGPFEACLEATTVLPDVLPSISEALRLEFVGKVQGDSDPERGFSGDSVNVTVEVRLIMRGRRLAGGMPVMRVLEAALDWSWAGSDEDDAPRLSFSEALGFELNITDEDAQALQDAQILPHEASSGDDVGAIIDLTHCARQDVARRVAMAHGGMQIVVLGGSFDYLLAEVD